MAKIDYTWNENKTTGRHSFYARPVSKGTLTMDDLLQEALGGTSIEPSIGRAAITEFMKTVQREVQRGFRCQLGERFLTIYPTLELSVKDTEDTRTHETVVATPKMLNASNAYSRLGCTVHKDFSKEFAKNVSWRKVDRTGAAVDPEGNDIVEDDPENPNTTNGGNSNGGNSNGGNGNETPAVAAPTISGTSPFADTTQVTLTEPEGARVYYTTDGSTPTAESTLYTEPFTLTATTIVKAVAIKDGVTSAVATKTFSKSTGGSDTE